MEVLIFFWRPAIERFLSLTRLFHFPFLSNLNICVYNNTYVYYNKTSTINYYIGIYPLNSNSSLFSLLFIFFRLVSRLLATWGPANKIYFYQISYSYFFYYIIYPHTLFRPLFFLAIGTTKILSSYSFMGFI